MQRPDILSEESEVLEAGAQERCLHNSIRQMNGIFQFAALSIWRLWSVPTSQEFPNPPPKNCLCIWGIQWERSWCLYSTREHDATFQPPKKIFTAGALFMGLMGSRSGAGGREMVEMFPLICHRRIIAPRQKLVLQFAFGDFPMAVSAEPQQSAESSKGWSSRWRRNRSAGAGGEEDYRVRCTLLTFPYHFK